MESKNITKITKHTKKQICCFLLFTFFVVTLCLSPFFLIYKKDMTEKRTIDQLIKITSDDIELQNEDFKKFNISKDISLEDTKQTSDKSSREVNTQWIGDCILIIPDIDLTKIVYTGKNRQQHLDNYELITADDNMQYSNGGNYIICGHASRLYGHSLNRLKEITKGSIIQVQTKDNVDEYIVNQVTYENMDKTSQYCNQTPENTLTIISCAKHVSDNSYIVIHAKLK